MKFQISNFKFQISKGFTLIEVITALGVSIVVGSIVGSIFLSSLKGTTKATTLSAARQNGTFAISQIEKTLRNAQKISTVPTNSCSPTPTPVATITATDINGNATIFSCSNGTISSNGQPLIDTTNFTLSSCSFSCIQNSLVDYPTITVQLTVTQKNPNASFFEQKAIVPFQTSVTLRSLNF